MKNIDLSNCKENLLKTYLGANGNKRCIIYNSIPYMVKVPPVYDCGSCLFPQMDIELMKTVVNSSDEIKNRVYVFPNSAVKLDSQKINYKDFIDNMINKDCNEALKRIFPKLKQESINKIIDETPYISDLQKTFYKKILEARRTFILEPTYKKLIALEKTKQRKLDDYYDRRR